VLLDASLPASFHGAQIASDMTRHAISAAAQDGTQTATRTGTPPANGAQEKPLSTRQISTETVNDQPLDCFPRPVHHNTHPTPYKSSA
jgi:hypothetical protein